VLSSLMMQAQDEDLPDPMSPPRLVNDFAKLFDSAQLSDLEQIALAYNDTTSTQIYVVTVSDLKGYDVSDFAIRLGEKWHIGQKDKNNGVLILIKPRIGNERGQVFIATGYGVEHILTDARTGRIIDQYMKPYLQNGDYYNATKAAMYTIIRYLAGEFQADDESEDSTGAIIANIIVILIVLFFIYIGTKNNKGGTSGGGQWRRGGGFFGGGGGFGGGWGGTSSGGGGFGGGGGGSFGGGGAGRGF
jgi:uncharacterized protein